MEGIFSEGKGFSLTGKIISPFDTDIDPKERRAVNMLFTKLVAILQSISD